ATIDWGDGTSASPDVTPGTVVVEAGGGFAVTGAHAYAEEGAPAITATIADGGGGKATAPSAANVADAALTAAGATVTATEGTTFTGTVATFTDAVSLRDAVPISATIDWGDGTSALPDVTPGTVVVQAGGGFAVTGSHAYAEEG